MLQPISWLALVAIHVMPALAFFRPALLTKLYRIEPHHRLFLLMQHRAGLFLAVVITCLIAAFHAPSRPAALAVTAVSMFSFLALYFAAGSPAPLKTIARVDLIGLIPLAVAAYLTFGR
jgi:uncharacterized membrane protein